MELYTVVACTNLYIVNITDTFNRKMKDAKA